MTHEAHEHRVSTGLIALYAASLNQTSAVLSSGSTAFHLPDSLVQRVFVHGSRDAGSGARRPCVLGVLTELSHSPYAQTRSAGKQPSGPVVDLSLYKCSTKRKIPVRPLIQPMIITLGGPPRIVRHCLFFSIRFCLQVVSVCTVSLRWSPLLNETG